MASEAVPSVWARRGTIPYCRSYPRILEMATVPVGAGSCRRRLALGLLPQRVSRQVRARMWAAQSWAFGALTPMQNAGMPERPDVTLPLTKYGKGGAGYLVFDKPLTPKSVVYAVGVGNDISFDQSLIDRFELHVHAFDPTNQSRRYVEEQQPHPNFHFHQLAIGGSDGRLPFRRLKPSHDSYLPGTILDVPGRKRGDQVVKALSLASAMEGNGHKHVDLLKLDVEGGEFVILESLCAERLDVRQIVFEVHPHLANLAHHSLMWGKYGWRRSAALLRRLRSVGYDLAAISDRGTEFTLVANR